MVNNLCRNGNSADGIQVYDYTKITPNNCIVWGKETSQIKKTLGALVSVVNQILKGIGQGWKYQYRSALY